jgi:predicted DNA-binding transcriptional regulator AlpA
MGTEQESDKRIQDGSNNILLTCDVARMLHKSEACIHKWRAAGIIPDYAMPTKIHPGQRSWNWSKRAILRWIGNFMPEEAK